MIQFPRLFRQSGAAHLKDGVVGAEQGRGDEAGSQVRSVAGVLTLGGESRNKGKSTAFPCAPGTG